MIDKRKFIRIPHSLQIAYEIASSPKTQFYLTRNVSRGGVCFFTREFIPKETLLKLRFSLPGSSYDGFARVVWIIEDSKHERFEIGAEFMTLLKMTE